MPNKIETSILKLLKVNSYNDAFKVVGIHVFILLGLTFGALMFIADSVGLSADNCLPGDLAIIVVFTFSLYFLKRFSIEWALKAFYFAPFIVYFFFISESSAIFPIRFSVQYTLWILSLFLIIYLLFSENILDLVFYSLISFATLFYHIFKAQLIDLIFHFKWIEPTILFNPLLILLVLSCLSLLLFSGFNLRINSLEQKIEKTESLVNFTFKNLPVGVLVLEEVRDEFDVESHLIIRRTNLAFERLFKITSRELKDQKANDVLPKVFRNSFDWNKYYLKSKTNNFDFYLERLDMYYEVKTLRIDNSQIVSLFWDVSDKQSKINLLEISKHRYQVLLEAIPDLFFIIDKDGIYVDYVFKKPEDLNLKPDDIIGNSIFEVGFSNKMASKILQCIQVCIDHDSIETIEYALEIEQSSALFEMRIARLNDHSVISLARDITKRKLAEIRIEEAKNKAEEADRLKTAFLANISHEIRTPMNAIIGFSKMVGSPDFSEEEKNKFVEIIITNGISLLNLINDMISLSKIESNTLDVKKTNCRVNDLMLGLYKEFGYEIEDHKNVKLKIKCENTNPKFSVYSDPVLLNSVMQKLIDNGIKFTEVGEVEFGYRLLSNKRLEFYVKDTGIGIDDRDREKIFHRFHQLDNRTIRAYEGTGLGLSIAQHYVRLIDGELKVKSKPGKGSEFSFSIPFAGDEPVLKIIR